MAEERHCRHAMKKKYLLSTSFDRFSWDFKTLLVGVGRMIISYRWLMPSLLSQFNSLVLYAVKKIRCQIYFYLFIHIYIYFFFFYLIIILFFSRLIFFYLQSFCRALVASHFIHTEADTKDTVNNSTIKYK